MCLTGLWRELLDKPAGRSKRKHLDFNAPSWLLITLLSNLNWLTVEDFFHHPLHVTAICLIKYLLPLKDYKILTSLIIWVHVVGTSGTNFRFWGKFGCWKAYHLTWTEIRIYTFWRVRLQILGAVWLENDPDLMCGDEDSHGISQSRNALIPYTHFQLSTLLSIWLQCTNFLYLSVSTLLSEIFFIHQLIHKHLLVLYPPTVYVLPRSVLFCLSPYFPHLSCCTHAVCVYWFLSILALYNVPPSPTCLLPHLSALILRPVMHTSPARSGQETWKKPCSGLHL